MTGFSSVAPQGVVLHLSVCSVCGRTNSNGASLRDSRSLGFRRDRKGSFLGKQSPQIQVATPDPPIRKCYHLRCIGGGGLPWLRGPLQYIINSPLWEGGPRPISHCARLGAQCPCEDDKIKHKGKVKMLLAIHTPFGVLN